MKTSAMFIFAMALSSTSLPAQKLILWNGEYQFVEPEPDTSNALTRIFSNLGPSTAAYYGGGWMVSGKFSVQGAAFSLAMPFQAARNSHVKQVQAAVQYNGTGANQVNLSLYSDNNGVPGTLLAGPVTVRNLPTFFTCCQLAVANFTNSVAIIANTRYWVVANTPGSGTGSDFDGVWSSIPPSRFVYGFQTNNTGWGEFNAPTFEPAGAVFGTIP